MTLVSIGVTPFFDTIPHRRLLSRVRQKKLSRQCQMWNLNWILHFAQIFLNTHFIFLFPGACLNCAGIHWYFSWVRQFSQTFFAGPCWYTCVFIFIFKIFNVRISRRRESILSISSPNFYCVKGTWIIIFYFPRFSINLYFKENLKVNLITVDDELCRCRVCFYDTLLFLRYCLISSVYQVFSSRRKFFFLFPFAPTCVVTCRNPLLWVKIAGIRSPMAQQSLSVVVKRSTSAKLPFWRLWPTNELMNNLREILKVGPHVTNVFNRCCFFTIVPPKTSHLCGIIKLNNVQMTWQEPIFTVAMHRFNTNVVSGFSNISDPVEHLSQPGIDTREVGIGTFISKTHNSNLCVPVNWTLKSKPINNQWLI